MTRRTEHVLAATMVFAGLASCHTAMVRLERGGSAAITDSAKISLRTFFDGRYIPLPSKPFVNCFDVVGTSLPSQTCDQTMPGVAYKGYVAQLVPRTARGLEPPWWVRNTLPYQLKNQLIAITKAYAPHRLNAGVAKLEVGNDFYEVAELDVTDIRQPRSLVTLRPATSLPVFQRPGEMRWLSVPASDQPDAYRYRYIGVRDDGVSVAPVLRTPVVASSESGVLEHSQSTGGIEIGEELPRAVLSFIHASDAQIREPAAKLGGQVVSDTLDPFVPTFAHDYEQELFSAFYYEAIIRTVNAEIDAANVERMGRPCPTSGTVCESREHWSQLLAMSYRPSPQFMIHTGDAVDAGLLSEFEEFQARSDLLTIPWFNVIGNHDVLGIGNLELELENLQVEDWSDAHQVDVENQVACTPLTRMLREYYLERPTQNGGAGELEAATRDKSKGNFSVAPIALREVCLDLEVSDTRRVRSDRFVADRRRVMNGQLMSEQDWSVSASARFVEAHCRGTSDWRTGRQWSGCTRHLRREDLTCGLENHNYPLAAFDRTKDGFPTESKCSRLNGFDTEPPRATGYDARQYYPGYYAFPLTSVQLDGTERPMWLVALNTTTNQGAFGRICHDGPCTQKTWLVDKLAQIKAENGLAIVVAHHPIWGIENDDERRDLKAALFADDVVIAYVAGHTHAPQLRVVEEDCTSQGPTLCGATATKRIWEIVGPSTLEFPQQARQVTLYDVPGTGLAYFEVLSFSPQLQGAERSYVERAHASAKRDFCTTEPESCVDGEPKQPEQYLSYPRLWFKVPPVPKGR